MIHVGGFTPWAFKYVNFSSACTVDGGCIPANPKQCCHHRGVETEWATMKIFTAYNAFDDADACCIGAMANSALYQHFPLPSQFHQTPTPSYEELVARGLVNKSSGLVIPRAYCAFYAGDYDGTAWLYSTFRDRWDDPNRGKVPIGWAVNSELSMRFPVIYPYLYRTRSLNDTFISGDSGAGYLNPTELFPPRVSNISLSGGPVWQKWNERYYQQFDLSFTGFIINADAGTITPDVLDLYSKFSSNGIVLETSQDPNTTVFGQSWVWKDMPVLHHVADLVNGDVDKSADMVVQFVNGQNTTSLPSFMVFRTILQTATYHYNVAESSRARSALPIEWVDPHTLGALARIHAQSKQHV